MAPAFNDTDYNGTYYDYYDYSGLQEELAFHVALCQRAIPVLFGLITVVGSVGNLMVIVVILRHRHMRTTVNISLLNLAFCDFIYVSLCVPIVTYHYAADTWLLGDIPCKLFQFLLYATVYVNVYSLALVSALIYITIVHGAATAKYRTRRNIIILITIIWAVMLVGNCPVLIVFGVKAYPEVPGNDPYYYCGISSKQTGQRLFLIFFVLTYVLPLSTIATLYVGILRYLNRKQKQSFRLSSRSNINGGCMGRAHEQTLHATRIVIIVVVVFGACYLPLHVHLFLSYFGVQPSSKFYQISRTLAHFLAFANSCLKPFIFNYASKDFRLAFRTLFRCSRDDHHRNFSTRSRIDVY